MSEVVTLELPENVARSAQTIAARTHRRVEDVLMEWIDHAVADLPIDALPDDEVLALSDLQMTLDEQEELSDLLAQNREGTIMIGDRLRLEELMSVYRRGLVRKAQAINVAVARGLAT
jgi:hypothetical protein